MAIDRVDGSVVDIIGINVMYAALFGLSPREYARRHRSQKSDLEPISRCEELPNVDEHLGRWRPGTRQTGRPRRRWRDGVGVCWCLDEEVRDG